MYSRSYKKDYEIDGKIPVLEKKSKQDSDDLDLLELSRKIENIYKNVNKYNLNKTQFIEKKSKLIEPNSTKRVFQNFRNFFLFPRLNFFYIFKFSLQQQFKLK